jgi:phosphotransacetylase
MALADFDQLQNDADNCGEPVPVAVAGGAERTVLEALRTACDRGWAAPLVVGHELEIRRLADASGIGLHGFTIIDADEPAEAAVAQVRSGRARILMKGQVSTPALMRAVLDSVTGLRTGRVICQVVLMEVRPGSRRFLLADTGVCVRPTLEQKVDILRSTVEVAWALGAEEPRVAALAASETVTEAMPETLDAAELQRLVQAGAVPGCVVQGPLSFDLAYVAEAGDRKRVAGPVVGAAEVLLFPDLVSANLTVKAIMYTADCRFGGVLCGAACPVVFMSRSDATGTRLNSLALALRLLSQIGGSHFRPAASCEARPLVR